MNVLRTSFLALAILVVGATPAFGHATIAGDPTYPAGTDQRITMDVPNERGDTVHNTGIKIYLPADWTGRGCEAASPWRCTVTPNALEGRTLLEWTKDAGAGPTTADETFVFTARTGSPGRSSMPVNQTYSSGETVRWIGPEGSEAPAPVVTVTAATATTTTGAPGSTTTAPISPTTSAGPTVTNVVPTTTSTIAGAPTTTTAAPVNATTTSSDATTTTSGDDGTTTTTTTEELRTEGDDDAGGGSSPLRVVLALLVAAGAIGAAVVLVRRRRSPVEPPPPPAP